MPYVDTSTCPSKPNETPTIVPRIAKSAAFSPLVGAFASGLVAVGIGSAIIRIVDQWSTVCLPGRAPIS
jgi:hypothetical protein